VPEPTAASVTAATDATSGARAPARAPKLLPPTLDQGTTVPRPDLEHRLAEGASRRLTVLVAGPGFGKSTLAARIAAARPAAWYTVDASDRHLGTLATGIASALRLRLPDLPADVAAPVEGSIDPRDDADALSRAQAAAAIFADALQGVLRDDLLLVIDDLQAIADAPPAWRFVEALVRVAPPELHLLIASRTETPFGIERLRGQGQVVDVGGPALAFSAGEIAKLIDVLMAHDGPTPRARDEAVGRILRATGGWPAAVRLAVEAYRAVAPEGRAGVLDRLQRPEGPIFPYLAEEVVARVTPATRDLIRRAVHFDRFTAGLCEAIGAANAEAILADLARRALFLQSHPDGGGWYTLHGLVREYTLARLPLEPAEVADIHRRAAAWFDGQGLLEPALASLAQARDPERLARFLSAHAPALVLGGATREVVEAAATLPAELRDARVERACGEALLARGDWRSAYGCFERAAGQSGRLDAATAWRMGLVHGLRGAYGDALAIYDRAERDGSQPADEALLDAWIASAHYHRGDVAASREAAERSLAAASAVGDDRALAAAHTGLGMSHELAHDPHRAAAEYGLALAAAERAGDALQVVRIRNARGVLELGAGNFGPALDVLDDAVRLADAVGFAAFHARALVNRGSAKQGVGRFEEALADFSAARAIYDRIGSPSVAYALTREGSLHLLRGDMFLARSGFESAVRAARDASDNQALAPALVGLAQAVVLDDPALARALVGEALELGREIAPIVVHVGAARVALALGADAEAARHAAEAAALSSARQDAPGLAAALEIQAVAGHDPVGGRALVEEAARIWERTPAPYGKARNRLIFARVVGGDEGRTAAVEAERAFRSFGARGPAAEGAAIVDALDRAARPPLVIQALGRFRVVRDGEVVPATAWQSKKARDLLKILVARRGRPTTRETFFDLLWPDEDPGPLGNRLSVALATARTVLDPERAFPPEQFIVADKTAIALDLDHVDLDIERFLAEAASGNRLRREGDTPAAIVRLEAAEALYAGDFLEEDPYEDWAVGLREEAQATYIAIARQLAEHGAGRGDADGATRYYLRILERDTYDEGAHLGLVTALVAAGRHGEARRRYGFYATKMEEIAVEAAPFPAPARRDGGRGPALDGAR
jgi:DNA-binding SARP family transcriptional activator/tetratricopeptide (TPR) repeat protein